mgnify:CR=1 FL=1
MRARQYQKLQTAKSTLQTPVIILITCAILAILLMASILMLHFDQKNEVAALRAELEALKQEQELIQRDIISATNRMESLEQTIASQISADVTALGTDIEALRHDQMAIYSEVEKLIVEVESLKNTEPEQTGAAAEVRLNVPRDKQDYSLTCEASAASMVANFYGVSLSEAEVIAALPRDENPNLGFRGRVHGVPGGLTDYGVYAEPIREILMANGLEATYVEGGLEGIRRALDRRHPVIAWVTHNLRVQQPVDITLSSGQRVRMVNYEHTVVVTGYNQDGFWVNDPYDGQEYFYKNAGFARSLGYLDNMALEVAP